MYVIIIIIIITVTGFDGFNQIQTSTDIDCNVLNIQLVDKRKSINSFRPCSEYRELCSLLSSDPFLSRSMALMIDPKCGYYPLDYCLDIIYYSMSGWCLMRGTMAAGSSRTIINPQMPKVFRQPKTPKGGGGGWCNPPLDFAFPFPSEFLGNISHGYVFGVKESNGDNEKILSLLHDLENQGQTPFCITFHISGCKRDTKLILVSILTFSRSWISNMLKTIMWSWRLTLKLKVTHINCMTFLISGCIQARNLISVSILTFAGSRISKNAKSVTWLWWLTLKMKVKHIFVWPFVSLVVNIIQTWSLYRF